MSLMANQSVSKRMNGYFKNDLLHNIEYINIEYKIFEYLAIIIV